LLLRATIGVALVAAVAASVVRAESGHGRPAADALRASTASVNAQNVAAAQPGSRSSGSASRSTTGRSSGPAQAAPAKAAPAKAAPAKAAPAKAAPAKAAPAKAAPAKAAPAKAAPAKSAGVSCRVSYAVTSRAPGRMTAVLTLVNVGRTTIDGWTLRWSYPAGTQVTNGWNATVLTDARGVQAMDAGLNRQLPAGGTTTIGFDVMTNGTDPAPSAFTLNGVVCR
jgi:endoglucanase